MMRSAAYASGIRFSPSRFTGKERDTESASPVGGTNGLDYFGARYNSSGTGRFMTPDPLMASAHAADPPTWNRYSYALNNPLRFIDLDGRDVYLNNDTSEYRRKTLYALTANMTVKEQRNIGYTKNKAGRYEMNIKDPSKIKMSTASEGYRQLAARIGDHSVQENVTMVPRGGSVLDPGGKSLTWSMLAGPGGAGGLTYYTLGTGNGDVFFAEGGQPYGVAGLTASGSPVGIAMPEDILAVHEALAETLKLMSDHRGLQQTPMEDSLGVINMENKFRDFQGLPHRSGLDHQNYPHPTVITVTPQ